MTPQQLVELKLDEGTALRKGSRLVVYDDATGKPIGPGSYVVGHPTIGIGRALDTNGLSDLEADFLLSDDVTTAQGELSKYMWYLKADPVRQGVLEQLAFNLGITNLLTFRLMLAAVADQDWNEAGVQLLHSRWASQVQASRRDRLIQELTTGVVKPAPVTV
jgi:lysozyme